MNDGINTGKWINIGLSGREGGKNTGKVRLGTGSTSDSSPQYEVCRYSTTVGKDPDRHHN